MKQSCRIGLTLAATVSVISILAVLAQAPPRRAAAVTEIQDVVIGPGGPGGPRMGGPMMQDRKIVEQFDKNSDGRLDNAERPAAREFLAKEQEEGRGPRQFGPPGGPGGRAQTPPEPGKKISLADAKSYGDAPLYDPNTLRTLFLEFENEDWEQELSDFRNTDVEVPAKLMVDGKTYQDVGVHFRGMSSLMGVPEGRKRSLNLSLDYLHEGQNLLGYRTLNLLNAHGDPSFLRAILFLYIAREYIPASKANFARVVINGEDWGIYQNVQQFNKDFLQENFPTSKGARWKVRGSPGGQGSLAYLGNDPEAYKRIYTIKSKDNQKSWEALIRLCKVLNETPPERLEAELSPILDIDGALKFIALDNALINSDGYWIRTSDYSLYLDEKGKFHIIPQDVNETFARPGGPGGPGGMHFGPAAMLVPMFLEDGDTDRDQKLSAGELKSLAESWFATLDSNDEGEVDSDQFAEELGKVLPQPQGFRGPPGGFGPARFIAPGLFAASDLDKNGELTRAEFKDAFAKWSAEWDTDKDELLSEEELRTGLAAIVPQAGPMRGFGPGGPGGPGGSGGRQMRVMAGPGRNMPRVEGVKLDPLVAANDPNKPLISKLLAVPKFKERYLGYVREIADKHLDWEKLGPAAERYHALIAPVVREETRKLDSTEAFEQSISGGGGESRGGFGRISISLKKFADQRREYLLDYNEGTAERN